MKKRKKIFWLLDKLSSTREELPKVVIKGCRTGSILYEGSFFQVPFSSCCDYVLRHEENDGVLTIVSTCSPYQEEGKS